MPDLLAWWRRNVWHKPDSSLIPEAWVRAARRAMDDEALMCVHDDSPQAWAAIDAVLPLIARDPEVIDRAAEVCGRGLLAAGYGNAPLSRDLARDVLRAALVPQTTHGVSSRQGKVYGKFRDERSRARASTSAHAEARAEESAPMSARCPTCDRPTGAADRGDVRLCEAAREETT